ncbi:MAG: hypothetical protein IT299_02545 [Dehalococcoidia bacterium]|nr:hypothetical protein [Dehalococcoidia bacterium]
MTSSDERDPRRAAMERLSLEEVEEAAGELQRRLGVALRRIGERDADRGGMHASNPRRQVAELAALCEVTAIGLGAIAAGLPPGPRLPPAHPTLPAAIAYGAPNLAALLTRLEQDRRLLTSLARQLESRLDLTVLFGSDGVTPRQLLLDALIEQPARLALELEQVAGLREL